jgi:hypothetical protein
MSKLIDQYLTVLDESNLNEGLGSMLNQLFAALGFGWPASPKFKAITRSGMKCNSVCYRMYPPERETTTRTKTRTQPGKGDEGKDLQNETQEVMETLRENPDLGKCMTICLYDKVSAYVDVIKKNRKTICDKNINKDLCEKWIDRNLSQLEADVKVFKSTVGVLGNRNQKADPGRVEIVIKKLSKLL